MLRRVDLKLPLSMLFVDAAAVVVLAPVLQTDEMRRLLMFQLTLWLPSWRVLLLLFVLGYVVET